MEKNMEGKYLGFLQHILKIFRCRIKEKRENIVKEKDMRASGGLENMNNN
jgi:hypothetical protein